MGEIADGLINGDFDFYTGEYLGRGGGFPRTGNKSLPWERGHKKRKGVYGSIVHFCMLRGYAHKHANGAIKRYGIEVLKIDIPKAEPQDWRQVVFPVIVNICGNIQADFESFKNWFKQNYPNHPSTH